MERSHQAIEEHVSRKQGQHMRNIAPLDLKVKPAQAAC